MLNIFACLLVCLSFTAMASSTPHNALKSQWIFSLGAEQSRYYLPWDYTSPSKNFRHKGRTLSGGRFTFGREFSLFAGLIASTKIEGYYLGTLFTKAETGGQEAGIDITQTKRTGQLAGADVVLSLGYSFPMSFRDLFIGQMNYLRFEPYVEIGTGRAWAFNKLYYTDIRDGGREYEHIFSDVLLNSRLSIGFNLTSLSNYFMYVRATANDFTISERTIDRRVDGASDPTIKQTDAKMAPVMIYAVGGGYKF
jgi:hypothetical protein